MPFSGFRVRLDRFCGNDDSGAVPRGTQRDLAPDAAACPLMDIVFPFKEGAMPGYFSGLKWRAGRDVERVAGVGDRWFIRYQSVRPWLPEDLA
mgnify:CR=1 FL=1